jgi:hypothetical protein
LNDCQENCSASTLSLQTRKPPLWNKVLQLIATAVMAAALPTLLLFSPFRRVHFSLRSGTLSHQRAASDAIAGICGGVFQLIGAEVGLLHLSTSSDQMKLLNQ